MELRLKVIEGNTRVRKFASLVRSFSSAATKNASCDPTATRSAGGIACCKWKRAEPPFAILGSRNGTLVNDQRVEGPYVLKTGDRLTIGQLRFEVELTTGLKGQKQPVVKDVKDAAARTRNAVAEIST